MKDNVYAIIGSDLFLVESEVEKMIQKLRVDPFNILSYDLDELELQEFLQEITTVSLLSDRKVIKVKNPWFFYETREDDLSQLIRYFQNPKSDTTLIFMLTKDVDSNTLVSREAKKYIRFEHLEALDKKDFPNYIKSYLEQFKYHIEEKAIQELLERVNFEFHQLFNELEKLRLFAYDSKKITLQDIKLLVPRNIEDNLFELTSAVIQKNKKKALEVYYDLIVKNIDPIIIISSLSTRIKDTITTKHLLQKGFSQQSIADYFNVSFGRAYYMVKNANDQNLVILERHYAALAELDYKIKSGQIEKKLGFELWLLEGFDAKKPL